MSQSAIQQWPAIRRRLRQARYRLLLFDYDGTLTPLVNDRSRARLSPQLRRNLKILSKMHGITVGIVSGRPLGEIRRLIRVSDLIYAGNHGRDIAGRGLRFTVDDGDAVMQPFEDTLSELKKHLVAIPGTEAEDKGLSASIHYRKMPTSYLAQFRRILRTVLIPAAQQYQFRLLAGKKTVDIFPTSNWNKGIAVEWMRKHIHPRAVVLYMGDDKTDDDVFQRLRRQDIAIRLGSGLQGGVPYRLRDPRDAEAFVNRLITL